MWLTTDLLFNYLMKTFNRVLAVKKTTKFERIKATGLMQSKYVEDVLMKTW